MRFDLKLQSKILLLAAAPLVFQLTLLAAVAYLQDQAEREAELAQRSRHVADEVLDLIRDIYAVRNNFGYIHSSEASYKDSAQYQALNANIEGHFRTLRSLCQDNPKMKAQINQITESLYNTENAFNNAHHAYWMSVRGESVDATTQLQALKSVSQVLSDQLVALANVSKDIANASPEKQRMYRAQVRTILMASALGNILLALALSVLLSRSIIRRLNIINENSYRLASHRSLNKPIEGTDEIAQVDRIFHKMAQALTDATSKERAILESAYDCICIFDENLKFVSTNAVCQDYFGKSDDELISTSLSEYLSAADYGAAVDFMAQAKTGAEQKNLQLTIRRADGESKDVLCSGRWAISQNRGELFAIFHDISEYKKAEQLKQEVMAMISHDMRSPLMTISSFLEVLASGYYDKMQAKYQIHRASAERAADRMMQLIGDLLDIEKFNSGMLKPDLASVLAADLLSTAAEESRAVAADAGVVLKVESTGAIVRADSQMILRVLNNLISNGIKYSPKGGAITLAADKRGDLVKFAVTDEGPGLPPESIARVFEKFHQEPDKHGRNLKGSGLGLTICKAIITLHGGDIWAESEEGKGTRFYFCLPSPE